MEIEPMQAAEQTKELMLKEFITSLKKLRQVGILLNQKDFTGQLGEWLVEELYEGKRAKSAIQKGWDVLTASGEKIQVKAHAKGTTNANRWSVVNTSEKGSFDTLILIVFSPDYQLEEFYKIPFEIAQGKAKLRNKKNPRPELNWSDVREYQVNLDQLPHQEIVRLFLN